MKEKDWKLLFEQCPLPKPGEGRKEEQMGQIMDAYRSLRPLYRKSRLQKWEHVAGSLSPFTWLLQAGLLLLLGFAFLVDWMDGEMVAVFTAPLMGIVGMLELMRSYAWNMWELEQSCRYNLLQMMSIKMMILGLMDLLVLLVAGAAGAYGRFGMNGFLLQILIPFLLSDALYLWLLGRFRNTCGIGMLLAAGMFMAVGNLQVAKGIEAGFEISKWMGGPNAAGLLTLLSVGILAISIYRFLKSCDGEERKVWNFD